MNERLKSELKFTEREQGNVLKLEARVGAMVLGSMTWRELDGLAYIRNWKVRRDLRGQGIGRALVVEWLRRHGRRHAPQGTRFAVTQRAASERAPRYGFELGSIRARHLTDDGIKALRAILTDLGY